MEFNNIKSPIGIEDVWRDILADIQVEGNKDVYYVGGFYLNSKVDGVTESTEYIGKNDLGVEGHLKPLYDIPRGQTQSFKGVIPIEVFMVNKEGIDKTTKVPITVGYENTDGDEQDITEYLSEWLDSVYDDFAQKSKNKLFESDNGEVDAQTEVREHEIREYYTSDIVKYYKAILRSQDNSVFYPNNTLGYNIEDIITETHKNVFLRVNRTGKGVILKTEIQVDQEKRPQRLDHRSFIVPIKLAHQVQVGKGDFIVKYQKKVLVHGEQKEIPTRIQQLQNEVDGYFNKSPLADQLIGIRYKDKQGKNKFIQKNVTDNKEYEKLVRELSNVKNTLILFNSKRSYERHESNYRNYVVQQINKYKGSERYKTILNKYLELATESQFIAGVLDPYYQNMEIPLQGSIASKTNMVVLLVIGPHYALIVSDNKYQVIYNLFEDHLSIEQTRSKISKFGQGFTNLLNLALDLADRRKSIKGAEIDQSLMQGQNI